MLLTETRKHRLIRALLRRVKQGFGLSETSPVTHCQRVEEWAKFMGSVGKLYPNMEAKVVDESGKEVAEGEVRTPVFVPAHRYHERKLTIHMSTYRQGSYGSRGPTSLRFTSTTRSAPRMPSR